VAGGGTRKAEQAEATRRELLAVARELFAAHGYAATSLERVARDAHVTRGALYHHFDGKRGLFRAVYEALEGELVARVAAAVAAAPQPARQLEAGVDAFLDACLDPAVQQIVLLDAPSALGWDLWHELNGVYGLGLVRAALAAGMELGTVERQPLEPLAHLMLGALNEAALAMARADDVTAARREYGGSAQRLLAGLAPRA
jgi:AcrR family transcriptional regulator